MGVEAIVTESKGVTHDRPPSGSVEPVDVAFTRTMVVGLPVRALKTAELIALRLRSQIVRGVLAPGDVLPAEAVLMDQFGVSRPTLREAFRILEAESLLSVRRGSRGGARVTSPDLAVAARYVGLLLQVEGTTTEDVFEARAVLEPGCARLLALRRTDKDLADLRAVCDEIERDLERPYRWEVVSELVFRFSSLVRERSGSRTLALQGAVLQDIIATHNGLTLNVPETDQLMRSQLRRLTRSYRVLIRLVDAHDADGAAAHWKAHVEGAAQVMRRTGVVTVVDLFR